MKQKKRKTTWWVFQQYREIGDQWRILKTHSRKPIVYETPYKYVEYYKGLTVAISPALQTKSNTELLKSDGFAENVYWSLKWYDSKSDLFHQHMKDMI